MKRLEFHISYICNHKCIFCSEFDRMNDFSKFPLSLIQIKTILIDRRKKGFDHVNFTGGEPTLIPHFLELLKFTKKLGYRIYVGTNGTLFYSPVFAQEALKYIDELSLSVHWHDQTSCEKQTGLKSHFINFPTIIKNINKYRSDSIMLFTNIVINRYNYTQVDTIMQFLIDIGYNFNQVLISNVAPEGIANHNYGDLVFDFEDFGVYIPKIIDLSEASNKILRFFGVPICVMGDQYAHYANDLHWESRHTIERFTDVSGKVKLIDVHSIDNSRKRCFTNKCENCVHKGNPCTGVFERYLEFFNF